MAAGLAHELRNPIAGMEVLAGLLQRRLHGDPEALGLVIDLRGQLRQLAGTVTASLDYLRPVALCREPVDIALLAEEGLVLGLARAPQPARVDRQYRVSASGAGGGSPAARRRAREPDRERVRGDGGGARTRVARLAISIDVGPAPELARAVRVDRETGASGGQPRASCGSRSATRASGFPRRSATGSSIRSSRPARAARGSGSRTCRRSCTRTADRCRWSRPDLGSVFRVHLPLPAETA